MSESDSSSVRKRLRRFSSGGLEAVSEAAQLAGEKVEKALTVIWDDLAPWQQDNHYITSGYRPQSYSFKKSLASLTYLHNETVNVYTHLLGAVASTIVAFYVYTCLYPRYNSATHEDVVVFGVFAMGCFLCLSLSATYHLFSNHSEAVNRLGNKLDYLGIVAMIGGSYVPSIYYGFYCSPYHRDWYWGLVLVLGLACCVVTLHPKFRTPELRPYRAAMYVAYGASGAISVLDGVHIYGFEELARRIQLNWVLAQGSFYVLGAVIYAARVPERLRPGSFDLFGSSHQIFHCMVLLAAATHFAGLIRAYDYLHGAGAQCPNVSG